MLPIDPIAVEALLANVLQNVDVEVGSAGFGMRFERALYAHLMAWGCVVMEQLFEALDSAATKIEEDGVVWTAVFAGPSNYVSRFGNIRVERRLYRSVRNGPTRCLMEEQFGIFDGKWTPDAARMCALLLTDQTSRFAANFLNEQGGMTPSRTMLERLPTRLNEVMEANREHLDAELRDQYTIPPEVVSVAVALDGVMVKLQGSNRKECVKAAKNAGRKVGGPIGSSEASVGSLSFYDTEGNRVMTRRFGRMPEPNKQTLKEGLRGELERVRAIRPDLIIVAVSDGAPNNWSFLESLNPNHQIVDAYHVLEHIKRRLDRALGVGTHANQTAYATLKDMLLNVAGGHSLVFDALERIEKHCGTFKERKKSGRGTQPTFYERHSERMQFLEHRLSSLPIGSGVVEGTARYMVVDRLRRTGMRWKHPGGQGVLTLRQYVANGQFNQAWDIAMELEAANNRHDRAVAA